MKGKISFSLFRTSLLTLTLMAFITLISTSCSVDAPVVDVSDIENLNVDPEFDYATIEPVLVEITVKGTDEASTPLEGIEVSIYKDPFNDQGLAGEAMFTGQTGVDGRYSSIVQLPKYMDHVYVQVNAIGFPNRADVPISAGLAMITMGGYEPDLPDEVIDQISNFPMPPRVAGADDVDYTFMGRGEGDWNNDGVPHWRNGGRIRYERMDGFLDDLNEALPAGRDVAEYLLADAAQSTLVLSRDAEVTVAFVHEGAGYTNAMGFYTFDPDNPPSSADDIDEHTIIFPNASYRNDGGGMQMGHNVTLGDFDAGTGIGWFLVADGWDSRDRTVDQGYDLFYSHTDINPEEDEDLQRHLVFMKDDDRELLLLGFEDIRRDGEGEHPYYPDHDFNDVVFTVLVEPWDAVNDDIVSPPSPGRDRDNDGVPDDRDEYPDDEDKAYNNYFPGESSYGFLAFEDKWPHKGDFDFNDLVIAYRFNQITNSGGSVSEIVATFDIKAVGAGYQNGFAFELPVEPDQIESVTGYNIEGNYIRLNRNGTEANQRKSVIIVYDNARDLVQENAGDDFVNTERGASEIDIEPLEITIVLSEPVNWNIWADQVAYASPPYNPFLIANRHRGYEVHLPDYPPTSLADRDLFGTGHDDSNFGYQRYYKTVYNLPWALNLPSVIEVNNRVANSVWHHPLERTQITVAYTQFADWAESGGEEDDDWYLDRNGHLNWDNIWIPAR